MKSRSKILLLFVCFFSKSYSTADSRGYLKSPFEIMKAKFGIYQAELFWGGLGLLTTAASKYVPWKWSFTDSPKWKQTVEKYRTPVTAGVYLAALIGYTQRHLFKDAGKFMRPKLKKPEFLKHAQLKFLARYMGIVLLEGEESETIMQNLKSSIQALIEHIKGRIQPKDTLERPEFSHKKVHDISKKIKEIENNLAKIDSKNNWFAFHALKNISRSMKDPLIKNPFALENKICQTGNQLYLSLIEPMDKMTSFNQDKVMAALTLYFHTFKSLKDEKVERLASSAEVTEANWKEYLKTIGVMEDTLNRKSYCTTIKAFIVKTLTDFLKEPKTGLACVHELEKWNLAAEDWNKTIEWC